jgi:hypothetical protein
LNLKGVSIGLEISTRVSGFTYRLWGVDCGVRAIGVVASYTYLPPTPYTPNPEPAPLTSHPCTSTSDSTLARARWLSHVGAVAGVHIAQRGAEVAHDGGEGIQRRHVGLGV